MNLKSVIILVLSSLSLSASDTTVIGGGGGSGSGNVSAIIGAAGPYDLNTLVRSDLSQPEFQAFTSGTANYTDTMRNAVYDPTYGWMHYLNYNSAQSTYPYYTFRFSTPPGTPGGTGNLTLSCPFMSPSGNVGVTLSIVDASVTVYINKLTNVVTTTSSLLSITQQLTNGTGYAVFISLKPGSTVFPIYAGALTATWDAGTGLYASDYRRIPCDMENLWDNISTNVMDNVGGSPYSRFIIDTTATSIGVETMQTFANTNYGIGVKVNDQPWTVITPVATNGFLTNQIVSFPTGKKRVEFINSPQTRPVTTPSGTWVRSLFISTNDDVTVIRPQLGYGRRITMLVDSIGSGFSSTNFWNRSIMTLRDSRIGEVTMEGHGYDQLYSFYAATYGYSALIERMKQSQPTDIIDQLGYNDWYLHGFGGVLTYSNNVAALYDQIHARIPGAHIWALSPVIHGNGTDATDNNALSEKLPNYRTAKSVIAAARPTFVTYIDGSAVLSSTDLDPYDYVHLNSTGNSKIATAIIKALRTSTPLNQ